MEAKAIKELLIQQNCTRFESTTKIQSAGMHWPALKLESGDTVIFRNAQPNQLNNQTLQKKDNRIVTRLLPLVVDA